MAGTQGEYGTATFFEFDPIANTFTDVTSSAVGSTVGYVARFLDLPNGQIMVVANGFWLYTPAGAPQDDAA